MKKIILAVILSISTFTNYYKININSNNLVIKDKIEIPAIKLNQNIYSYEISNVDKNIIMLKESNYNNNLYILASHSGNSSISYFKNLSKIKENDLIILTINNKSIKYKVKKIEYILKNGYMKIPKNSRNVLYLTTCDRNNPKQQLVVKCVKNM